MRLFFSIRYSSNFEAFSVLHLRPLVPYHSQDMFSLYEFHVVSYASDRCVATRYIGGNRNFLGEIAAVPQFDRFRGAPC
jgi:hypothetical protein